MMVHTMMYTEKSDGSDMNYTSTKRDRYCEVVDSDIWSCLDHRFSELISRGLVELPASHGCPSHINVHFLSILDSNFTELFRLPPFDPSIFVL